MAKGHANPNTKENSDAYPRGFNADAVRKQIDPDSGAAAQHESDLAKLDREHGPLKGGR